MANESTMDKMHQMRLSVMARAYREQEDAPGIAEMGFDERLAMIVDAEWDARRVNKRMRLLRQAGFPEPDVGFESIAAAMACLLSLKTSKMGLPEQPAERAHAWEVFVGMKPHEVVKSTGGGYEPPSGTLRIRDDSGSLIRNGITNGGWTLIPPIA